MDALDHRGAGGFLAIFPDGDEAAPLRRRDQRLVCRSSSKNRLLQVRPDELPRSATFLSAAAVADLVWAQSDCAAIACRPSQHRLRVADPKIRTFCWPHR